MSVVEHILGPAFVCFVCGSIIWILPICAPYLRAHPWTYPYLLPMQKHNLGPVHTCSICRCITWHLFLWALYMRSLSQVMFVIVTLLCEIYVAITPLSRHWWHVVVAKVCGSRCWLWIHNSMSTLGLAVCSWKGWWSWLWNIHTCHNRLSVINRSIP